jgi:WD domain, G-beta repeat
VVVYDAATLTEKARLRGHSQLVRALQFSHDGRLLVSASADHTAVVWELGTGRKVLSMTGHADAVLALTSPRMIARSTPAGWTSACWSGISPAAVDSSLGLPTEFRARSSENRGPLAGREHRCLCRARFKRR